MRNRDRSSVQNVDKITKEFPPISWTSVDYSLFSLVWGNFCNKFLLRKNSTSIEIVKVFKIFQNEDLDIKIISRTYSGILEITTHTGGQHVILSTLAIRKAFLNQWMALNLWFSNGPQKADYMNQRQTKER